VYVELYVFRWFYFFEAAFVVAYWVASESFEKIVDEIVFQVFYGFIPKRFDYIKIKVCEGYRIFLCKIVYSWIT
jgi:hypothetical protein